MINCSDRRVLRVSSPKQPIEVHAAEDWRVVDQKGKLVDGLQLDG